MAVDVNKLTDKEKELVLSIVDAHRKGVARSIAKSTHDFVKDGYRKMDAEIAALRPKLERL